MLSLRLAGNFKPKGITMKNKISEFLVLDGPHAGIRLDLPKHVTPPPCVVLMTECSQTGEFLPDAYDLVVQPEREGSDEMVACYQHRY